MLDSQVALPPIIASVKSDGPWRPLNDERGKIMNKKVISFAAAMMLAALPLAAGSAAGFTAGEYEASAQGFGGPVTVKVTVDADTVTAVEVTGEGETPTLGGAAIEGYNTSPGRA